MKAGPDGPRPAFDASNGYVQYKRDANADFFEKSESSYKGYGNARRGVVCDAEGNVIGNDERHRPRDYATVTTDRYRFRYDGRWLLTSIRISPDDGATYGPDLVDRWKARAFQQDPSSETPCCGYEEEDTNWGGSSTLLGERVGPVRAIRETWGADSGTNVIRQRDLLSPRDEPEVVAASAPDPAARRHLRAVGLQRRRREEVLLLRASRQGVPHRRPQRRGLRQLRRSVQRELRRHGAVRRRQRLPRGVRRRAASVHRPVRISPVDRRCRT